MKQIFVMLFFTFFINNIHASDVSKDNWVNMFKEKFTPHVCKKEEYKSEFRDKYGISGDKCTQLMTLAVSLCMESYDSKIPQIFKGEDGSKFGTQIGGCSQKVYESSLKHLIR